MKDDLVDGLTKYLVGLGGLHNFAVHIVSEPSVSWDPRPPPRCSSAGRDLVKTFDQWTATCTISVGYPEQTCLNPNTLHARPVRAALADCDV